MSSGKRWAELVKHMGNEPKHELIKKARRLYDERVCASKKRFYTAGAAWAKGSKNRKPMRVYQCPVCRLWHLTTRRDS